MEVLVRKLVDKAEMLSCLNVLTELYPSLSKAEYNSQLDEMIPHNYFQVGAFEGAKCIGLSGVWIGNKLWCGKYLEIDHIVVAEEYRSKGIGKLIFDFMKQLAKEENCGSLALDSFTFNHQSHKLFFKEDFIIKGYHFVNILDDSRFR